MSTTERVVYFLVESNPLYFDNEETRFTWLLDAQKALRERVADLVADDYAVTGQTDYSARLVDAQGESVSLHIVEASVRPLVTTEVRDQAHMAELLGIVTFGCTK